VGALPQKRKYRPTGKSNALGQTNAFTSGGSRTFHSGGSALSSLVLNERCMPKDTRTRSDSPYSCDQSVVGQSSQDSTSSVFASSHGIKGFSTTEPVNLVADLSVRESSGTEEDGSLPDQQSNRRFRVPGFMDALRLLEAEADKWLEGQTSKHSLL